MRIRTPVVAGMFYPKEKQELQESIRNCVSHKYGVGVTDSKQRKIYGVICPHAGYEYSGPIATHSYAAVADQDFELAIILGPNHWGIGCNIATMKDCTWNTPLGNVDVDSDAATQINAISELVEIDFFSHSRDHSIEVQIPMLQEFYKKTIKILPIILASQDYESSLEIGHTISKISKIKKSIIVGSSDFTHYEENEFAHKQDAALIKPILKLDVEQFYHVLNEMKVSACGYGAIASTMIACKELGATRGELLSYATSGDIAGDRTSVVGYASIIFS